MSMTITPLRLIGATIAASAAYGVYEVHRLNTLYPYDTTPYGPPVDAVFPPGMSPAGRVTTTIARPPKRALADPLGTFTAAFYPTWTLRLEALGARLSKYTSLVPSYVHDSAARAGSAASLGPLEPFAFCSGLFQGIYRDTNNLAVFWSLDPSPDPDFAGIQIFSASINDDNEMVVSFGGRELSGPHGATLTPATYWFHRMYSRFLVDRAKTRLEKWAAEGK